jgi:hypothetical protein
MDRAGRNKILARRRGKKSEEGKSNMGFSEEDGAGKTARSNRQH